jgi:GT2 family glycosyltransferase
MKINKYLFYFSSQGNQFWNEIGLIIANSFRENGKIVEIKTDEIPIEEGDDSIQVIVGGHEYLHTFLKDESLIREVVPRVVALTGEQPGARWFSHNLPYLKQCRECWDITAVGAASLLSNGITARHLPIGLSPSLLCDSPVSKKEIDVLFMGSATKHRQERIARYGLERYHHKNHFQLVELGYAKTNSDKTYLDNKKRNALCANSKILLNYHGHLIPFFEWHRALLAMGNGALLLSDPVMDSAPLIPGIHYVTASEETIDLVGDYFLEFEEHRELITGEAKEFLHRHWQMKELASRFLNNEPVTTQELRIPGWKEEVDSSLKKYLCKRFKKNFALGFAATCVEDIKVTPINVRSKNSLEKRKEKIKSNILIENSMKVNSNHYHVEKYHYDAITNKDVRISVIVSLYNYGKTIVQALDSILLAVNSFSEVEIIVVDDGSTDNGPEITSEWMKLAPCRCQLIKKKINTGFIRARNMGIEAAAGEYIAILDADNAFLPGGLSRLLDAMSGNRYDAAYGIIISVNGRGKANGLLSSQSWDPGRLVYGPYIDAMALFRKSTMIELGLYDEEMYLHGWFGWEDYEFWLRLADKNKSVNFIPNFVALYRSHFTSMIHETNEFLSTIIEYLKLKYEKLLGIHGGRGLILGNPE